MLKAKLFDYQEETVKFGLENPYSIIALDMGLGKTVVSLAIAERLNQKCLVIAPAYLLLNWKKELEKFVEDKVVTIIRKGSQVYYPFDSDYVVVSYDLAIKADCLFEWADMVVLDEATAIKSMSAKRTQAIHRLIYENSIKRVHMLTGTPIKNRVQEFYSLLAICNYKPNITETPFLRQFPSEIDFADYFSFRHEYLKKARGKYFKVVKWEGLKNEEELKKWLDGYYISRKSTIGQINYKDVVLSDFDDEALRKEFDDYRAGISKVAPQVKAQAALRKAPLTCKYVSDLIENGEIEGPVIVFTDHVLSCKYIADFFKTRPITGEMPVYLRQQMADDFQDGKIPVLVATVGAFSSGYTLTRSNFLVWNDLTWVPGDIAQAEYRILRVGQNRPVHVHRMLGSEQDAYIMKTILEKSATISKVF